MADRTSVYQAVKKYDAAVKVLRDLMAQSKELDEKAMTLRQHRFNAEAEVNKAQKALLDAASPQSHGAPTNFSADDRGDYVRESTRPTGGDYVRESTRPTD